jgi:oxygen-dependent protoporphyrinogen oxidase
MLTYSQKGNSPTPRRFDSVISTLPAPGLTDAVTVMVINLYWKKPDLVPQRGFGYLIPRSIPFEQNPERALGVIFDHDAVQGQDTYPGTKLTVMMGGHWWNGWEGYPDSAEGAEMAKAVVRRHLNITEEPDICNVTLNKDCIPQYTVGYEERLRELANSMQDEYNGRVRVVGSQYNGVGVNDCIRAAWRVAHDMKQKGWMSRSVGLDKALDDREWVAEPVAKMGGERVPLKDFEKLMERKP